MRRIIEQDGKWYEIGIMGLTKPGDMFLASNGEMVCRALGSTVGKLRHLATLIPDTDPRVVMHKLGENAYNSIEEELRPRITGEFRKARCGDFCEEEPGDFTKWEDGCSSGYSYIILSPPEPEPKTDREMLEHVAEIFDRGFRSEEIRKLLSDHLGRKQNVKPGS